MKTPRTAVQLRYSVALTCAVILWALPGCVFISPFQWGPLELQEVRVQDSSRWLEINKIALVDVDGVITSQDGGFWSWTGTSVADVRQRLKKAEADRSVVAVVLRINSPGGEATAADILYEEIENFRVRTGKPVVACLMNVATSGGYYVALGADQIVAHPTTVTGSVGVIMPLLNYEGLFNKIGLKAVTVKSGDKKDIGSGTRPMTEEERAILEGINRQLFEKFLSAVHSSRRGMTPEQLKNISDGRVLTATEALQLRMIDHIGYLTQAIELAKKMANVADAHVVLYRSFPHYNQNIYAMLSGGKPADAELLRELLQAMLTGNPAARPVPGFYYLWMPGM